MGKHIAVIQGHPDPAGGHFCHALAERYVAGAVSSGHEVRTIAVAELDFPLLRTQAEYEAGEAPADIKRAQQVVAWADHLLIVYPLWVGDVPALLKGFLEQVLRPGFAVSAEEGKLPRKLLKGKSARLVVTMGMPALAYRWYFGAHSLKSLKRNALGLCGIGPIRASLVGLVDDERPAGREKWLSKMSALGRDAR